MDHHKRCFNCFKTCGLQDAYNTSLTNIIDTQNPQSCESEEPYKTTEKVAYSIFTNTINSDCSNSKEAILCGECNISFQHFLYSKSSFMTRTKQDSCIDKICKNEFSEKLVASPHALSGPRFEKVKYEILNEGDSDDKNSLSSFNNAKKQRCRLDRRKASNKTLDHCSYCGRVLKNSIDIAAHSVMCGHSHIPKENKKTTETVDTFLIPDHVTLGGDGILIQSNFEMTRNVDGSPGKAINDVTRSSINVKSENTLPIICKPKIDVSNSTVDLIPKNCYVKELDEDLNQSTNDVDESGTKISVNEVSNTQKILTIRPCIICGKKFPSKRKLNIHLFKKHKGSYKCNYCDVFFRSVEDMFPIRNHLINYHKNSEEALAAKINKTYFYERQVFIKNKPLSTWAQCKKCFESFRTYRQLHVHMIFDHYNQKECLVCKEKFDRSDNFLFHLEHYNHIKQKKEVCSVCNIAFRDTFDFIWHFETSKKHNPLSKNITFACEMCGEMFSLGYELRSHYKWEHGNSRSKKRDVGSCFDKEVYELGNRKQNNTLILKNCNVCKREFKSSIEISAHFVLCGPNSAGHIPQPSMKDFKEENKPKITVKKIKNKKVLQSQKSRNNKSKQRDGPIGDDVGDVKSNTVKKELPRSKRNVMNQSSLLTQVIPKKQTVKSNKQKSKCFPKTDFNKDFPDMEGRAENELHNCKTGNADVNTVIKVEVDPVCIAVNNMETKSSSEEIAHDYEGENVKSEVYMDLNQDYNNVNEGTFLNGKNNDVATLIEANQGQTHASSKEEIEVAQTIFSKTDFLNKVEPKYCTVCKSTFKSGFDIAAHSVICSSSQMFRPDRNHKILESQLLELETNENRKIGIEQENYINPTMVEMKSEPWPDNCLCDDPLELPAVIDNNATSGTDAVMNINYSNLGSNAANNYENVGKYKSKAPTLLSSEGNDAVYVKDINNDKVQHCRVCRKEIKNAFDAAAHSVICGSKS